MGRRFPSATLPTGEAKRAAIAAFAWFNGPITVLPPDHPAPFERKAIENGLGLPVTAAAEGLGVSRKTLSQILNGRARTTTEMAIRLEKGIGSSAAAWLRMQMAHDLALAQGSARSIKVKKLAKAS